MLALKEVLGHARVSTTEIYTHLSKEELKEATNSNPLASVTPNSKKKDD